MDALSTNAKCEQVKVQEMVAATAQKATQEAKENLEQEWIERSGPYSERLSLKMLYLYLNSEIVICDCVIHIVVL